MDKFEEYTVSNVRSIISYNVDVKFDPQVTVKVEPLVDEINDPLSFNKNDTKNKSIARTSLHCNKNHFKDIMNNKFETKGKDSSSNVPITSGFGMDPGLEFTNLMEIVKTEILDDTGMKDPLSFDEMDVKNLLDVKNRIKNEFNTKGVESSLNVLISPGFGKDPSLELLNLTEIIKTELLDDPEVKDDLSFDEKYANNKLNTKTASRCKKKCFKHVAKDEIQTSNSNFQVLSITDKPKPFVCEVCKRGFANRSMLNTHITIHSGLKTFACEECDSKFKRLNSLRRHILTHSGEKPYKCNLCLQKFGRLSSLKRHNITKHTLRKTFECEICKKRFLLKNSLKVHIRKHSPIKVNNTYDKPDEFDICKKKFAFKKDEEKRHKNKDHLTVEDPSLGLANLADSKLITLKKPKRQRRTRIKKYMCDSCSRTFFTLSQLEIHLMAHNGFKPFICEICGGGFTSKSSLTNHITIHSGLKAFACKECESKFNRLNSLRRHMLTHSGEKPYECNLCLKKFNRMSSLKRHGITRHREKIKLECEICKMKFSLEKSLRRHNEMKHSPKKIDDSDKPYECVICKKKFKFQKNLIRHQRRDHPTLEASSSKKYKPFKCNICEKEYALKNSVKKHVVRDHAIVEPSTFRDPNLELLSLTDSNLLARSKRKLHPSNVDDKPFVCDICEEKFAYKQNIIRHIDKCHPTVEAPSHENLSSELLSLSDSNLLAHGKRNCLSTKVDGKPYKSNICKKKYAFEKNLKRYKERDYHRVEASSHKDPSITVSNLSIHNERKHNSTKVYDEPYKSDICKNKDAFVNDVKWLEDIDYIPVDSSRFSSDSSLELPRLVISTSICHKEKKHKPSNFDDKPYESVICKKKYEFEKVKDSNYRDPIISKKIAPDKSIKQRKLIETGNQYACDLCSWTFLKTSQLESHLRIHKGLESLICEICGRSFVNRSVLRKHMSIHSGLKAFACKECDSKFNRLNSLQRHMLTHSGDKPYECNLCLQKFNRLSSLQRHNIALHNEKNKFKCRICKQRFPLEKYVQLHNERKHRPTNSVEKLFECDICKKKYGFKGNMKKHRERDHGIVEAPSYKRLTLAHDKRKYYPTNENDKPYECDICKKKFAFKGNMNRHKNKYNCHLEAPSYRNSSLEIPSSTVSNLLGHHKRKSTNVNGDHKKRMNVMFVKRNLHI